MVKAIFWDNDGILVDTEHLYFQASKEISSALGLDLTESLYRKYFLIENSGLKALLPTLGLSEEEVVIHRAKRDQRFIELLRAKDDHLIAGVKDTLKKLHGRVSMAIVTSCERTHFEIIHKNSNILPLFDFLITPDTYTHSKPNPEPYLKALERTSLDAKDCLVIEDSERGLIAAKAAGLTCWIIPNQLTASSNFEGADKILSSVEEIPALLALS